MSFPSFNYKTKGQRGESSQNDYANKTQSELQFKSMITGHTVTFKAFLNEFSQNFASTWNSEEVFGRMDPIATFQGTKRTISVGWTVPAGNLATAKRNVQMINALGAMLYPAYSKDQVQVDGETITSASSIARPPLIKVKFSNLIRSADDKDGLLGYVDGFSFTPDLEMGMLIEDGNHYPKVYTISCQLNVLHQHDVGFDNENNWLGGDNYKKWIFGEEDE